MQWALKKYFIFIFILFYKSSILYSINQIEQEIYIYKPNSNLPIHKAYIDHFINESLIDSFSYINEWKSIPFLNISNQPIVLKINKEAIVSPNKIIPYVVEIEEQPKQDFFIRVYTNTTKVNLSKIEVKISIVREDIKITTTKRKVGFIYENQYFANVTPTILFETKHIIAENLATFQIPKVMENIRSYLCNKECYSFSINSNPSQSSAYLNNIYLGVTPIHFKNLPASNQENAYSFKFIKDGFINYQEQKSLSYFINNSKNNNIINIKLKAYKINNSLTITTTPEKGDVYLDAIYQGTTPLKINNIIPGKRQLKIINKKYLEISETLDIKETDQVLTYKLLPLDFIFPPANQLWGSFTYKHAFITTSVIAAMSFGTAIGLSVSSSLLRQEISQRFSKKTPGAYSELDLNTIQSYEERISIRNNLSIAFYAITGVFTVVSIYFLIKDFLVLRKSIPSNYISFRDSLMNKKILFNMYAINQSGSYINEWQSYSLNFIITTRF